MGGITNRLNGVGTGSVSSNRGGVNIDPLLPTDLFEFGEKGVWYDPSDMSTLFQDAAATTPVTEVGQPVGLILDKSGRGNHATQSTATSRPILGLENGKYYLAFDGVDDVLTASKTGFKFLHDNANWFAVAGARFGDAANPDTAYGVFGTQTSNSNIGASFMWDDRSSLSRNERTYGVVSDGTSASSILSNNAFTAPNGNVVVAMRAQKGVAGSDMSLRSNRVDSGISAEITVTSSSAATYDLSVGAIGNAALKLKGRMYGLIIREGAISVSQIEAVEVYMNSKTGAY